MSSSPSASPPPIRRALPWLLLAAFVLTVLGVVFLRHPAARAYHDLRARRYDARTVRALEAGRPSDALLCVRNALRHDPGQPARWELYARAQQAAGGNPIAARIQAWVLDPTDAARAVTALKAVLVDENPESTAWLVPRVVQALPRNVEVLRLAAAAAGRQNAHALTTSLLQRAATLAPNDAPLQLSLAAAELFSPEPNRATAAALRLQAMTNNPALAPIALSALATCRAPDRPEDALALWERVLELQPDNFTARLERAQLQLRLQPSTTESALDRVERFATNTTRQLLLARTAVQCRQPAVARRMLNALPPAERERPPALLIETGLHWAQGNITNALAVAARGLADSPGPDDSLAFLLWQIRGQATLTNLTAARAARDRAFDEARSPAAILTAARRLESWDLPAEALAFYEAAAKNDPAQAAIWARVQRLAVQIRDGKAALAAAEARYRLLPADPTAQLELAGLLLAHNRTPDRARTLTRFAASRLPQSPAVVDITAWSLTRTGDPQGALQLYQRLPVGSAGSSPMRLHHAEALFAAGRIDAARTIAADIAPADLFEGEQETLKRILGP